VVLSGNGTDHSGGDHNAYQEKQDREHKSVGRRGALATEP
jgi:hypothetical protein